MKPSRVNKRTEAIAGFRSQKQTGFSENPFPPIFRDFPRLRRKSFLTWQRPDRRGCGGLRSVPGLVRMFPQNQHSQWFTRISVFYEISGPENFPERRARPQKTRAPIFAVFPRISHIFGKTPVPPTVLPFLSYYFGIIIRYKVFPSKQSPQLFNQFLMRIPISLTIVSTFIVGLEINTDNIPTYFIKIGIIMEHGMILQETATRRIEELLKYSKQERN